MRWLLACVVMSTLLLLPFPAHAQTDESRAPSLDPRIGAAQPALFNAACSEEDWRNPLIDVRGDDVRVRSLSQPAPALIPLSRLPQTLVELPVSDWPYGRIVAIPSAAHLAAHHPLSADLVGDVRHQVGQLRVGWWTFPHCQNDRRSASLR